jgi:hypothetical protein
LIVGQQQSEIERDLGISQSRISVLLDDPLFFAKYTEMQEKTMAEFLDVRATAMEILQEAAPDAAQVVVDAFREGQIKGKSIGPGLMLNSAFDVLDRTGNKAAERSLVGVVNLGELIADAYSEKHGKSAYSEPKDEEKTDGAFNVLDIPKDDVTTVSETKSEEA